MASLPAITAHTPILARSGSSASLPGDPYLRDAELVQTPDLFYSNLLAKALGSTPQFRRIMLFHLAGIIPEMALDPYPASWGSLVNQPVDMVRLLAFIETCANNNIEVYLFRGYRIPVDATSRDMTNSQAPDPNVLAHRQFAELEYRDLADAGCAGFGLDNSAELANQPSVPAWATYLKETFGFKNVWAEAFDQTSLRGTPSLCTDTFKLSTNPTDSWVFNPDQEERRILMQTFGYDPPTDFATFKAKVDFWRGQGYKIDALATSYDQEKLNYIAIGDTNKKDDRDPKIKLKGRRAMLARIAMNVIDGNEEGDVVT